MYSNGPFATATWNVEWQDHVAAENKKAYRAKEKLLATDRSK
jgi:hypothetical protein